MTTAELSELDARATRLAAAADTRLAAWRESLATTRARLTARSASQARLEALHGDEWYLYTDGQHERVRRAWHEASQASDRAYRSYVRAQRKAERASNHRVIRTYTDSTGWADNPNFFGRTAKK